MEHFDFIIIGTGAGGGTLLSRLARSGKRILVLERGEFLPREKENWDAVEVFQRDRYHTDEVWRDGRGRDLHPGTGYWVGGNTKVYGAALFRMREQDFGELVHKGGVSPAWPIAYRDLEPYYAQAEALYQVRGERGVDPTEPWSSRPYPYPAVAHEPRIAELHEALQERGYHPFHVPLGVQLDEEDRLRSACIRCNTCDGFPCLVDAKSDSDVTCVRPALAEPNVTLITGARVTRLLTNPSGRAVSAVEAEIAGKRVAFRGDLVAVACGAINSAALLLRSANERHPTGLGNGSDQLGRNFMKHHNGAILAVTRKLNTTSFQKTLAVNDFYFGEEDFPFPMGHVSLLGKATKDMLAADAPALAPGLALDTMARHSVDFWLTAEDLPHPDNRVRIDDDGIILEYEDHDTEGFERLMKRWTQVLKSIDAMDSILPNHVYFKRKIPLQAVGHQCGTARFGRDPQSSVLDADCRMHELDNVYVVDSSFFPSSSAINPSLTIMANALRVGDHLLARVG